MSKKSMVSLKSITANALPEPNKETVANQIIAEFSERITVPNGSIMNDKAPASKLQPKNAPFDMGLVQ